MEISRLKESLQALGLQQPGLACAAYFEQAGQLAATTGCHEHRRMPALGVAQLGVVAYCYYLIRSSQREKYQNFPYLKRHRRPGTGILQYFPAGHSLPLEQCLQLILQESDITATNIVLDGLGVTQSEINGWLRRQGLKTTGLTSRNDRCFESALISPDDAALLLRILRRQQPGVFQGVMQRNHFLDGLYMLDGKYPSRQERRWHRQFRQWGRIYRYSPITPGNDSIYPVIRQALARPTQTTIPHKEGLCLSADGVTYRHDVGLIRGQNGSAFVAIFTEGTTGRNLISHVGRLVGQAVGH